MKIDKMTITKVFLMIILLIATTIAVGVVIKYAIVAQIMAVTLILFGGMLLFWGLGEIDK